MSDLHDFYRIAVGEQRADLVQAIRNHRVGSPTSAVAIRSIAHTLKGSGASFGFPAISFAAAATEHATDSTLATFAHALVLTLDDMEAMTPVPTAPTMTGALPAPSTNTGSRVDSAVRVLLAEDDPLTAALIIHRLERESFQVVHCANGLDAIDAASNETFHMVVLDVQMPGADGFAVLSRFRASTELADVPILLVTAVGSEHDVVKAFALGADDYILKPFSPAELTARVKRLAKGLT